jgi:hypothetical protein
MVLVPSSSFEHFFAFPKPDPLLSKAGETLPRNSGQTFFEPGWANSFVQSRLTLRLSNLSGLLNLDKALQVSITAPNISGVATLVVSCFVSFIIGVKFGCWQKRETLLEKPHLCAPGWIPIPREGAP